MDESNWEEKGCRETCERPKYSRATCPLLEKSHGRSVEELLEDLNNWERHVAPADLEELETRGISKVVIDEALRGIRFSNASFGAKELVQMHVVTLKKCVAAPDNVDRMYTAMHYPDEPLGMEIFDLEEDRQKIIREKRSES
jgi:hypothetical protein